MKEKLTISIDPEIYHGLHRIIGRGNISRFIEDLARPYLFSKELEDGYRRMAADKEREKEAEEWSEGLIGDSFDETR